MACAECTTTVCKKLFVSPCDTGIDTGIALAESGDYTLLVEFNGTVHRFELEVTADENIILPNVLNLDYTHTLTIYNVDNEVVDDTCYKLDITMIVGTGNNLDPTPESGASKLIIVDEDGQTFTDAFFALHEIQAISTENQTYLRGVGFTQSGSTITAISFGFFNGQTIFAQA